MKTTIFLFLLIFCKILIAQSVPRRLSDSPYPASQVPDTLFVVEDSHFTQTEMLTVISLQGLLAKTKPRIFRLLTAGSVLWLQDLIDNYDITADSVFNGDFPGLLSHFKRQIPHYILCHTADNSANAAISLAGVLNAICVTEDNAAVLDSLHIPMLMDVRDRDEMWVYQNYDSLFNKNLVSYQKEEKYLFLTDYSIFAGAFHFFEPIHSFLTLRFLSRMNPVSVLMGWGDDEYQTVSTASRHSIYVHPADWALNISTLTNMNAEMQQQDHADTVETIDGVHTVCFVMTDGDNIIWLLNDFATSEQWFGSHHRGSVNIGWTISPALCELAPTVMSYLYHHAAIGPDGKDEFIAGASGLGYMYPDKFPSLDSYTRLMSQYLKMSDLHIVNIIGDDPSAVYLESYLQHPEVDAVFYYLYSNYSGLKGKISWIGGKPVIGGRYNLWAGFESASSLAKKLNALPKDIHSPNGYSLIPVHVWSNNVDSVLACVHQLDEHVRVVTPGAFVALIQKNLGPASDVTCTSEGIPQDFRLYASYPNPFNGRTEIRYYLPEPGRVFLGIFDLRGDLVEKLIDQRQGRGIHRVVWNASGRLSSGIYFCRLMTEGRVAVEKLVLIK